MKKMNATDVSENDDSEKAGENQEEFSEILTRFDKRWSNMAKFLGTLYRDGL